MRSSTILALVGGAAASPAVNPQAAFCSAVTKGIAAANQQASASSFCSSYLSIPLKTATVTSTTYTSTYTDVSTTTTTTSVITAPVVTDVVSTSVTSFTTTSFTDTSTTTTDTTYVLATSTITSCANPTNAPSKLKQRALAPPAIIKPSALAAYAVGAPISSACSCLSIAPSTTTVTTVTSMVKTVSTTTSVGTLTTTTPHTTSTSTSTITSLISTTTTTWTSVQATSVTGTTTIVSLPTFQVKVVGGWNSGAYAALGSYANSIGVTVDGSNVPSNFLLNGTDLVAADGAYAGDVAEEDTTKYSNDKELVMFDSAADIAAAGTNADVLQCAIAANQDGTCPLTCSVNGGTLNFDCGTWWRIQQPGLSQYCSNTFSTYAVYEPST